MDVSFVDPPVHFIGDDCGEHRSQQRFKKIPLQYIRTQFQQTLMLKDFGIPQDYGGTRWHRTIAGIDAKIWLERNVEAILANLLFPELVSD